MHPAQGAWHPCRAAAEHEALEQQRAKRAKVEHSAGSCWRVGLSPSAPQPADLALWAGGDLPEPAGGSSLPTNSRGSSAAATTTEGAAVGAGDARTALAAPDAAVGRIRQAGSGLRQQGSQQGKVQSQQPGVSQQQGQAGGTSALAHQAVRLQPAQSQASRGLELGFGSRAGSLQSSALEAQDAGCVPGRMRSSSGTSHRRALRCGLSPHSEACHSRQRCLTEPLSSKHALAAAARAAAASTGLLLGLLQSSAFGLGILAAMRVCAAAGTARRMRPACSQGVLNAETLWVAQGVLTAPGALTG